MLGNLLKPEFDELIQSRDYASLREAFSEMSPPDIAEVIEDLPAAESGIIFRVLPRDVATRVFEYLPVDQQTEVVETLGTEQLVGLLNEMAPDDRTRLFEELPAEVTKRALTSLKPDQLQDGSAAAGLSREHCRPVHDAAVPGDAAATSTAEKALAYIREHGQGIETLNVVYVTDDKGVLLDDIRLSDLVMAPPEHHGLRPQRRASAEHPCHRRPRAKWWRCSRSTTEWRSRSRTARACSWASSPWTTSSMWPKQKATEDIQGLGGVEALDAPYFDVGFFNMCKKRGGWLSALFLGEMLTATAMSGLRG